MLTVLMWLVLGWCSVGSLGYFVSMWILRADDPDKYRFTVWGLVGIGLLGPIGALGGFLEYRDRLRARKQQGRRR